MSTSLSFHNIETTLQALLDTEEGGVAPEKQEEIQHEIIKAELAAVDKRDGVAHFITHLENQRVNLKKELLRLKALDSFYEKSIDRIEGYVIRTIQELGPDPKGKWRKLEGKTTILSILPHASISTAITDEPKVPATYRNLEIKVPAAAWEEFIESVDIEQAEKILKLASVTSTCDKEAIKKVIKVAMEKAAATTQDEAKSAQLAEEARIGTIPGAAITKDTTYSLKRK